MSILLGWLGSPGMATPESARTAIVYHVNPLANGALPVDMNTADADGDAFFLLREAILLLECAKGETHGFRADCDNPEVTDPDLVVTKLNLTYTGGEGPYGRCNLCSDEGVDPFSHLSCESGEYLCTCGPYAAPFACNDQQAVGVEDISTALTDVVPPCTWAKWMEAPWQCWQISVAEKTGGLWYSTTRAGWCDAPDADPSTCTWRARVLKVVNKTCTDGIIFDAVEAYDAEHGSRCFRQCPSPAARAGAPGRRNTTDPCWIYCYFETLLGRDGVLPGRPLGGMPMELVKEAFEKPFAPANDGGCPDVAHRGSGEEMALAQRKPSALPPSSWQAHRAAVLHGVFGAPAARPPSVASPRSSMPTVRYDLT
jgi:hypothetical protein